MTAASAVVLSVEPETEPDAGVDYKSQSDNHSLVETPAYTHRHSGIPTRYHGALTRKNRRSIRHGCKQSQKSRRYGVWK
jgi:hypothetical protein